MKAKAKKNQKQAVPVFDFTNTKCAIPSKFKRYRVKTKDTNEIAMAIPVYQEGILIFKIRTPHNSEWREYFKEDIELWNFDYMPQSDILKEWSSLQ